MVQCLKRNVYIQIEYYDTMNQFISIGVFFCPQKVLNRIQLEYTAQKHNTPGMATTYLMGRLGFSSNIHTNLFLF